jgi:class 3 adenylate cyclase
MVPSTDSLQCPHCGHFVSDQESSSSELSSYIEQLESFSLMPTSRRKALRKGSESISDLRLLPVLVARTDHYADLVNQHAVDVSDMEKAEMYADLLNQALRVIIPIIDQRGGAILELGHASILAAWGFPVFEDGFTRAVSTALGIQEALLRLGEEQAKSQDFALKIGIARGYVYAGTIGTSTHQSFGVFGSVVIEAARLSHAAEPGQTLVSHTIYKWTKDVIVYKQFALEGESAAQDIQPQPYLALRRRQ